MTPPCGRINRVGHLISGRPFPGFQLPMRLRIVLFSLLVALSSPSYATDIGIDCDDCRNLLTPERVHLLLIGEVAARRSRFDVALPAYFELLLDTRDPRIAQRTTEIAMAARDSEAAIAAARLWVAFDPGNETARMALASLLSASGKPAEVRQLLTDMLAADAPGRPQRLMQLNRLLARYPNRGEVLALVEVLVRPYLDFPEAHFAVAQAAAGADQVTRALEALGEARRLRPDWEVAVLFESNLLARESPGLAIALLKRFLQDKPEAHEVRLQYAQHLIKQMRLIEAHQEFEKLVKARPNQDELEHALGLLSLQIGHYDDAITRLQRLLDKGFGEADRLRMSLGLAEVERGRLAEARRWFEQVAPGEHRFDAEHAIVETWAREGAYDRAVARLAELRARHPEQRVTLWLVESRLYRDAGQQQVALDRLLTAMKDAPDEPEWLYEAALLADGLKQYRDSERWLRRLMKVKPDHAHAYNALGYSLAERGVRLAEAERLIDKALELAPGDSAVQDSKGWVLHRQGRDKEALKWLEKALAGRVDPEIAVHRLLVLRALGRIEEAMKLFEELKAQFADHPSVKALRNARPW